jgi:mannose-6-phosphate isomerase-like protein (cupin superfamily)
MTSPAGKGGFRVLRMRTLATAGDTNGAFELVEDLRNHGEGPAPHVHRNSEEAFYVLEGRFTFGRGSDEIVAEPGSFVFIPRGTRHFYRAMTDGARVLILYVPPGRFDDFLRELDSLLAEGMTSAQAMAAIRGKYDSDPA